MIGFKRHSLILGLLFLLTGAMCPAQAQGPEEGWQVYTNANYVNDLVLEGGGAQSGGYTWAASDGGVVCYGASELVKFTTLDGLADVAVRAVTVGDAGLLLFGTVYGGVSVLDDGGTPFDKGDDAWITWMQSDGLAANAVYAITTSTEGHLWFGTSRGASVMDNGGTPFDKGDDTWATFTTADGLAHYFVQAIAVDSGGRLWFATLDGVSVLDDGETPFDKGDDTWATFTTADGLANDDVRAIAIDGGGSFWFGTRGGGVSVLDDGGTPFDKADDAWTTFTSADGLVYDDIRSIVVDGGGRLWFGTGDAMGRGAGVSVLDHGGTPFDKGDDTWTTFTTADGLAHDFVQAIAVDSGGQLWFGTLNGVSVLDNGGTPLDKGDDTWTTFSQTDGLAYKQVTAIAVDSEGRLWFGTYGVNVLDDGGTPFDKGDDTWATFTTADGLAYDNVSAIEMDTEGYLWFGTSGGMSGGVSVLNHGGTPFDTGDDTWITFTIADGLAHSSVYAIAVDNEGRLWFGTLNGVSVLDNGDTPFDKGDDTWTTFTTADGLVDNYVDDIVIRGDGDLWFATYSGGVSVLDHGGTPFDKGDDTWTTFTTADGLAQNSIRAVAVDGEDRLWFGTDNRGMSVLDDGGTPFDKADDVWITFTIADGLASDRVWAIAVRDGGRLWLGTPWAGVSVLDHGGTPFDKGDDTWIIFTPADGPAIHVVWAAAIDDEGWLWFGTSSGGVSELVDGVAPSSSASSPQYTNGIIPVPWSATDGASSIFRATLWVKYEGGAWASTGLSQTGTAGAFDYTPIQGDGVYYFATVTEDWMGNTEAAPTGSGDDSTIYDSTAPDSSAFSPDYDNAGDIAVSWTASDATSGVSATDLWVKYGSGGSWADTGLSQVGTAGIFTYTPTQGDGTYFFATVASDNAANSEAMPTDSGDDSTVYDTTAPSASALSPSSTTEYSFVVSWSGQDATSGIASYDVQYRVGDDGTWQNWLSATSQISATFGPADPAAVQALQTYYFRVRATDQAGNVGTYLPDGDCSTYIEGYQVHLPIILRDYNQGQAD